jgi:hypothetical protein
MTKRKSVLAVAPDDAVRQRDWRQEFVGFALTQMTRILLLAQVLVDLDPMLG